MLFKYTSNLGYVVIELVIEVYFEWTIITSFGAFYADAGGGSGGGGGGGSGGGGGDWTHEHDSECWVCRQCASVMLFAHWCFLLAGLASLIDDAGSSGLGNARGDPGANKRY